MCKCLGKGAWLGECLCTYCGELCPYLEWFYEMFYDDVTWESEACIKKISRARLVCEYVI